MLNILQLCAGKGSRFSTYTDIPKPFIDVNGTPMFKVGLESISMDARVHCLFQYSHIQKYNPSQYTDATIHTIDGYTDGAATSAYSVISKSDYKNEQWIIIDCDFLLDADISDFMSKAKTSSVIFVDVCHYDTKSSYACVDNDMNVFGVAEKQVISTHRNTGQYHFYSGDIFCEAYEFYKDNEIMSVGEFYISPLYNYLIQTNRPVVATQVRKYVPLGTPDDLNKYIHGDINI